VRRQQLNLKYLSEIKLPLPTAVRLRSLKMIIHESMESWDFDANNIKVKK
jgi:hypothetical protein